MNGKRENIYSAQILRVDLSKMTTSKQSLDLYTSRLYLGGCALGAKYLYQEVPPNAEWYDPENRIMILGGPLSGTAIPGSGGFNVSTKGPMTGGAASTQGQGVFGAYLRSCDLIGLVIHGACDKWTYLVVDEEGSGYFRSAEKLVGKDTWETVDRIARELSKKERDISVMAIGPAGENMVRFACIIADKGHTAAHNGVGAVMGSKKLKAIVVVRSRKEVAVKDKSTLSKLAKKFLKPIIDNPVSYHYYGTLPGFHKNFAIANLPVKNYTTSRWTISEDKLARFSGSYITENYSPKRKRPCWRCPHRHSTVMTIPEGDEAGREIEEPDYEQLAALSSNLGIDKITDVMLLANLIDRLGMDVNETGWVLSCVMECFDSEILNKNQTDGLEMIWGNVDAVKEMIFRISRREGIGAVLAEGVMRAVKKIGKGAEEIGIYTKKGATPRSHDHRARWTELFDHCLSESGALDSTPFVRDITEFGLPADIDPYTYDPDMVVKMEVKIKGGMQFEDSLVTCRFNTAMNISLLVEAVRAVTSWDFTVDEAMKVGRRAVNLMRVFNHMNSITPDLSWPSIRYGSAPSDGPAEGISILTNFGRMLNSYYRAMGWDENGRPLPETLKQLSLEEVANDLWGSG